MSIAALVLAGASLVHAAQAQPNRGMLVAKAPAQMVVVMRVNADGGREITCVDSEEAVEQFLHPKSRPAGSLKPAEK